MVNVQDGKRLLELDQAVSEAAARRIYGADYQGRGSDNSKVAGGRIDDGQHVYLPQPKSNPWPWIFLTVLTLALLTGLALWLWTQRPTPAPAPAVGQYGLGLDDLKVY